jgi:hypothetical protein
MKKIINCGLLVFIALFVVSCASTSSSQKKTISVDEFSNSNVVVANFIMAPRSKVYIPLIDAGIYNAALNTAEPKFLPLQEKNLEDLNVRFSDYLKTNYNSEVINISFINDTKNEMDLNYYFKPSDEVKAKVIEICAENDAKYFIGAIGQLRTLGVAALGLNGSNDLVFFITIFDASGNIVSGDIFKTPVTMIEASDYLKFASLFEIAGNFILTSMNNLIS